MYYHNFPYLTL